MTTAFVISLGKLPFNYISSVNVHLQYSRDYTCSSYWVIYGLRVMAKP